eukprot:TRINITY_DN393_c0_g1_i1.p1 TRINITY_DN393_c0_g1~~TRINITY_DN393_c0_g1_i1.p1  ORF type:complete len:106 (+),score=13.06 TRINITY_DN393_c0_g1_i1:29-346(+)
MMAKGFLLLLLIAYTSAMKCSVDSEVRFILNNFNRGAVTRNVDCVVGSGPCDNLGNRLKAEAPNAVRQGRCGSSCTCDQIQVRLVVNKLKREYPGQWTRVVNRFS